MLRYYHKSAEFQSDILGNHMIDNKVAQIWSLKTTTCFTASKFSERVPGDLLCSHFSIINHLQGKWSSDDRSHVVGTGGTVNRGRPMFHSVTQTFRLMCCQQRRLPSPQPLLLFRWPVLKVPVLLQCLRWQTQSQKHASPSQQKKTYVQLHQAVFRIDDCVVLVKQ